MVNTVKIEKCQTDYKIEYYSKPLTFVLFVDKIEIKLIRVENYVEYQINIPLTGALFAKRAYFVGFEPKIEEI